MKAAPLLALSLVSAATAQNVITKADIGTSAALTAGTAWVGGIVPGPADTALFDATMASANNSLAQIGGDLSLLGLRIVDPKPVNVSSGYTISATVVTSPVFAYTGTLFIGSGGIDMSNAVALPAHTNGFFNISPPIVLTANQSWLIPRLTSNPNRELSLAGSTFTSGRRSTDLDLGGFTVTKRGSGIAGIYFDRTTKNGNIRIEEGIVSFNNALNAATATNIQQDAASSLSIEVNPGTILNLSQAPTTGNGAVNWDAAITLNGGTLQLNRGNYTGNIAPAGTITAATGSISEILYSNTSTAATPITPTLRSRLSGSGTLRLNMSSPRTQDRFFLAGNDSSFSGTFELTAGHALVSNTSGSATGTGLLTTAPGTTLGGTGRTGPLNASGTVRPGLAAADTATLSTGPASLRGALTIDIDGTAADVLDVSGPLDISGASLVLAIGPNGFSAPSLTIASADSITGTFASITPGYSARIVPSGNRASLVVSPASAFDSWAQASITAVNPNANPAFDADPDLDGIANGLEWILGGLPLNGSPSAAPTTSLDGSGNLVLSFSRAEASIPEASLFVDFSTSPAGPWSSSAPLGTTSSTDPSGLLISINPIPSPDQISVTIPASLSSSGRLFARLRTRKL